MSMLLAIAVSVIALDQATKWIVLRTIAGEPGIQIVPGCLRFEFATNTGGAFSMMEDNPALLTALASVAVVVILVFVATTPREERLMRAGLMMMVGGALANLFDRIYHGHVIDFILAYVGKYAWPTFNVADSFICVGAGIVVWRSFTMPNPDAPNPDAPNPDAPNPESAAAPQQNAEAASSPQNS